MAANQQLAFLEDFETPPPNPLFCHQEFLEKLVDHGRDAIGRRAAFLMQRLLVDIRRLHYKTTAGSNRGWRRSRLCGKPPLYEALDVPDRAARTQRLRQRAIQLLLKDKQ